MGNNIGSGPRVGSGDIASLRMGLKTFLHAPNGMGREGKKLLLEVRSFIDSMDMTDMLRLCKTLIDHPNMKKLRHTEEARTAWVRTGNDNVLNSKPNHQERIRMLLHSFTTAKNDHCRAAVTMDIMREIHAARHHEEPVDAAALRDMAQIRWSLSSKHHKGPVDADALWAKAHRQEGRSAKHQMKPVNVAALLDKAQRHWSLSPKRKG
jgi:hypothetical protein